MLIPAVSRYREYAADRGGAAITGNPAALAGALATIERDAAQTPEEDLRTDAGANALYIHSLGDRHDVLSLLETHPPTEDRIDRLRDLERELSGHD